MNGSWHGGKGDLPRKPQVTMNEADLRWELAFGKPTEARKTEILQLLEENKNGKEKNR